MKQLQKDANNRIITKNRIGGPNRSIGLVQTNTDNLYPYGGEITNDQMNPNAELEKEEQFRTPQGITGGVDGPEHSEGGIEVNLPEGTQVFSDRLKLDGKTYAKRAKSLNNKIAKLEKKPETQATKNSIMLLDQQLDDLFNTQEAMKEEKMAKKMFAKGGIIPAHNVRIMKVGGLTHYDGEEGPSVVINDPNKQLKYGFEDQTSKFAPAQPVQTVVDNYGVSRPTVSGATNPVLSSSTSPSQDNSSFLSPSNMALIGSIGNNIVQNQMINSVKRPRTISNVYFGAGPRPTRVDMSGERSAIDAEAAGAKRGLFLGSNSYSTQASNLQSIRNNQLAAKGRSFQNQANANTTIDNAYNDKVTEAYNKSLATNLGIDQYNMENQYNFDLWKTGNKLKNMGASNDLITNVFNNQTNKENQLAYWNVMKNMFEKKVGKDIGMPEKKYGGKIRTLKYKK